MRNNFCVCIFDFLSRFCANAAHWGPGHGGSELHGEGLHDVGDPLEVELVGVVGGVGEEGGAPDDRLRGVKVAICCPVFLPPWFTWLFVNFVFLWILIRRPGGARYHQRLPWSEPMMEAQDRCSHSTRQDG